MLQFEPVDQPLSARKRAAMFRMKTVSLDMFFDTDRVKRAAGVAARRNLSKVGAFVRTGARSSIRKRKGISTPGQPPSSRACGQTA